jgi:short subunit dehydrogenase-like uncharacterized protein
MLYGATGYTGRLLAQEAVLQGERPLLAGRDARALQALGESLGLSWKAVALEDTEGLRRAVGRVRAVLHAAGPFVHTAWPMVEACLETKAHYLDITGEWPVFEAIYARHEEALRRGVALVPGVGFDVLPTESLARSVAGQCPGAHTLTLAVAAIGTPSSGTARSALGVALRGNFVIEGGARKRIPTASSQKMFPFPFGEARGMVAPLADTLAIHRSTGIPNVACHVVLPGALLKTLRRTGPLLEMALPLARVALKSPWLKGQVDAWLKARVQGPTDAQRARDKSYVYAHAQGENGEASSVLETMEGYTLTAVAGVRAVKHALSTQPQGALTPSQLLGADFVLSLPDTRRG